MLGTDKKIKIMMIIIAVAAATAIFAALYYGGAFLPSYTKWHEEVTYDEEKDLEIELKKRSVCVYKEGRLIFKTDELIRVSNMIYTDIDRDGEKELILLNYNIGEFGSHRPFWVKFDPPVYRQHIYIYDFIEEEELIKPAWMASDIGVKACDFERVKEDVIRITDESGEQTDWMWISFGLRCLD